VTRGLIDNEAMDECCPKFDPSSFTDGKNYFKLITWNEKPFVKDGTWCFFYVPLTFGRAMSRALKRITDAGAESPKDEMMVLSECISPWYSDVYVSVAKEEVDGAEVEKISGTFLSKAFEGDYSNMGKWVEEMKGLVAEETVERPALGLKMYFYYPTCPKCAKKYGKNYVIIMAKTTRE